MHSQDNASGPGEPWSGAERRRGDRRGAPTRPLARLLGPLRRESGRREEDRRSYVDRYTKREAWLLFVIFTLNVLDAFFTMIWLSRGGREANPVMDFFLDIGPAAFIVQKCFFVGFWLVLLLVHKNFRFARFGLYAALAVYSALLIVHFSIIAFDVQPPPDPAKPRPATLSALGGPTKTIAQRDTAPRARP